MSFRPSSFADIIGQRDIIETLSISVDSANKRRVALGHTLLSGPAGLGKTTFANALASELGVDIAIANGANMRSPKHVIPFIRDLSERSILFIDEVHRLPINCMEFLYPVMEDFKLSITTGDSHKDNVIEIPVPQFTMVGATTHAGSLSAPFRDRFKLRMELKTYSVKDLSKLISSNAGRMNLRLSEDAVQIIAGASRGTPRIANSLLDWVRDYSVSKNIRNMCRNSVRDALKMKRIGLDGSTEQDRSYMKLISGMREPVGLKTLSSMLNIEQETIQNVIEPFLLQRGLIAKTKRGRVAVGDLHK